MASLSNLFGAYASDEEGEASGDLRGMDSGTNVVLLGGDAEMAEAGPAPAPAPGPERSGSEAAEDEAASSFPWAKPDALAALSGPAAAGGGVPRVDAAPEVADEGAAPEERGAGGAAERPRLPPELARAPPGPVDPDVLAKVDKLMQAKLRTGKRITEELRRMRDFRNPDFLQKMVDYFHIDHTGTCFAPGAWDPKSLPAEDFYDRLAAEFEDMIKRRRADAQAAGRVDFVRPASGPDLTRLPTGGDVAAQLAANAKLAASAKAQAAGAARRASKWDAGRR